MQYIISIAGLVLVIGLAFIASSDKKKIKYKPIAIMIVLQFLFGCALLNTSAGNILISAIANGFMGLLNCANEGVQFVFGGLVNDGKMTFFISVLMPITFISALIGILQHWKILPFIIKYIGLALSKVNGMGKLESYNAVASAILGQSEVFISVKKILEPLPNNRMYTLCASAMSTVSMSIVGAYMVMIEPRYVVTALVLNLFGGFIIASIINPYEVKAGDDILVVEEHKRQSFFEMLSEYILDGFKVSVVGVVPAPGFGEDMSDGVRCVGCVAAPVDACWRRRGVRPARPMTGTCRLGRGVRRGGWCAVRVGSAACGGTPRPRMR